MRICYLVPGSGQTWMRFIPQRLRIWASCRRWRGNLRPVGIKLSGDFTRDYARRHKSASIRHYPIILEPTKVDGTELKSSDFLAIETSSILMARPCSSFGTKTHSSTHPTGYGTLSRKALLRIELEVKHLYPDGRCHPARELCFASPLTAVSKANGPLAPWR